VWLQVTPEYFLSALSGVAMAASSDGKEAKTQASISIGFIQIPTQGFANQCSDGNPFPLSQEQQLTIGAFIQKDSRSPHMTYDDIRHGPESIGAHVRFV